MKTIFKLLLLLITPALFGQNANYNKVNVRTELILNDSTLDAAVTGDTVMTKEYADTTYNYFNRDSVYQYEQDSNLLRYVTIKTKGVAFGSDSNTVTTDSANFNYTDASDSLYVKNLTVDTIYGGVPSSNLWSETSSTQIYFDDTVSIGTSTAQSIFTIKPKSANDGLRIMEADEGNIAAKFTASNTNAQLSLYEGGGEKVRILSGYHSYFNTTWNYGFGLNNPLSPIHLNDNESATTPTVPTFMLSNQNSTTNNWNVIGFSDSYTDISDYSYIGVQYTDLTASSEDSEMSFAIMSAGTQTEAMVIDDNANVYMNDSVGIGNTSPAYDLDVTGKIRNTDTIFTTKLSASNRIFVESGDNETYITTEGLYMQKGVGVQAYRANPFDETASVLYLCGTDGSISAEQPIFLVANDYYDNTLTNIANQKFLVADNYVNMLGNLTWNDTTLNMEFGTNNLLITDGALTSFTTGATNNIIIGGNGTGSSGTIEDNAIIIGNGSASLLDNNFSTIIGNNAAPNLDDQRVTIIGYEALGVGTGVENLVLVGYRAGENMGTPCESAVAVGAEALEEATGAEYTVGVGADVGQNVTTIDETVAIGRLAASLPTTGSVTTSVNIGTEAGRGRAGAGNIFIGHDAGKTTSNQTTNNKLIIDNSSTDSLIVGDFSANTLDINGELTVTASSSSMVWDGQTLDFVAANGTNNTFAGRDVGSSLATGNSNTGFGANVLDALDGGFLNTAVGNGSLTALTTGNNNTSIGNNAGKSLVSNSNNVFIGHNAAQASTTSDRSVVIGSGAGYTTSNGDRNIFIGYNAGYYETGDDKLMIDKEAFADEATARTSSLLYGDFASNYLHINGTLKQKENTITDNDATPDVSGANIWTYNGTSNSVTVTDLDNPEVGAIYRIIGNSDTYTITINDSGNFNLSANWVGGIDDVITILVQADNDYIEISRSDN